ncbi:MAG: hypothetical protein EXS17_07365 [Phycisphaerales bacterium]|nr:hypothetical protein [Phycisphaerales bacterium]
MKDPGSSSAEPLKWVLQATSAPDSTPAQMLINWLVQEVDPALNDPITALLDARTSLTTLNALKEAFKHLRIDGETADDRSLAATYYALTIASALVNHRVRISRQTDHAIEEALRVLWNDEACDLRLRDLGWRAFVALRTGLNARTIDPESP